MHTFFASIESPTQALLKEDEYRHCIKSLRHREGDPIAVIDGAGTYYETRIGQITKQEVRLNILHTFPEWGEHKGHLVLALSPLRLKDRFEWAIEKAVELGVNEIIPIQTHHTEAQKARFKPQRLQTLMRTALKQCGRSRLPVLHPVTPFEKALSHTSNSQLYMAAMPASAGFEPMPLAEGSHVSLFIGPEGGFSPSEIQQAQAAQATLISLGSNRLRAETAAVYAMSLVKQRWGY